MQKGPVPVSPELPDYKTWQMWMAAHISAMDRQLDHAQDEAVPLVEWALNPMGHCWPKEEYASIIVSIIHLDSLCFVPYRSFRLREEVSSHGNGPRGCSEQTQQLREPMLAPPERGH